jgi:hypothetical protein
MPSAYVFQRQRNAPKSNLPGEITKVIDQFAKTPPSKTLEEMQAELAQERMARLRKLGLSGNVSNRKGKKTNKRITKGKRGRKNLRKRTNKRKTKGKRGGSRRRR